MKCVFTISTVSHLFKSNALADSIKKHNYSLNILLVDGNPNENYGVIESTELTFINELSDSLCEQILKKYKNNQDKCRWSLKSAYAKYLLEKDFDQVIYIDNDIFFYSSPEFLFEKLNHSSFLLTPHFYPANPDKNQNWLEANYRVGLYNAGFFGANRNAIPILNWWSECCLYNVKKAYWRGLFDDQKYLDLVPVIFDNVEIVKHRGCNFAGWNCDEVFLEKVDEQILVNKDPLVFIHFAQLSMERFSDPNSSVHACYREYIESLQNHQSNFVFQGKKRTFSAISSYIYYLRWKCSRLLEK